MKKRAESGEVIIGLVFLLTCSLPALAAMKAHREAVEKERLLMEEKLSDPNELKFYHHTAEWWEQR